MFNKVFVNPWAMIETVCKENPNTQAWLKQLERTEYGRKIDCSSLHCPNDKQYAHIKGSEVIRKLEAAYHSLRRPTPEIIYAHLGLVGLPTPGIDCLLGPETGIEQLVKAGETIYQFLYESVTHFESVPAPYCLIAAQVFCDKHDENFVEWDSASTGNRMFYANTGAYFDRAQKGSYDNARYIPPINGMYGILTAKR